MQLILYNFSSLKKIQGMLYFNQFSENTTVPIVIVTHKK